ncbi:MAG: PEP-CTERM sorting domain-containing protein [Mariniblastus sp.]
MNYFDRAGVRVFPESVAAIVLFCSFIFSGNVVDAQVTIVGYDVTNPNGSNGSPSPDLPAAEAASNVTTLLYSRGAGLIPNQGVTLNSSGWATSSLAAAIAAEDYLERGWSNSADQYDLEDMTIQYDRSNSGPTQLAIMLAVNGGAMQTVHTDSDIFVGDETHTIDLTAFDNVLSATVRLFAFDAASPGGTLDIERFNAEPEPSRGMIVRGFVSSVPEPGSVVVLCLVGVGFFVKRRRA